MLVSPELSLLSEGDGSEEFSPIVADVEGVRLLLHARQLRGRMTLVEASRRAGLNRDELSRLEKGETTQVRFSTIAKLLAAYGCSLADLVEVERACWVVAGLAVAPCDEALTSTSFPRTRRPRSPLLRRRRRAGGAPRSGQFISESPRVTGLLLSARRSAPAG